MQINNEKFDYILVDGHWCRDWSCEAIIKYDLLAKNGLVILDDYNHVKDANRGYNYLKQNNFLTLDFSSLNHDTSILYKSTNI